MDSYILIFNNLLILHHKIHYIILHHVILYSLPICFIIICLNKFFFVSLFSLCFHKAMHGVGSKWILRAFDLFGHAPFIPVSSQAEPDPEFHTVTFPNPEEKGVNKDTLIFIFYNFLFLFPSCLFFFILPNICLFLILILIFIFFFFTLNIIT